MNRIFAITFTVLLAAGLTSSAQRGDRNGQKQPEVWRTMDVPPAPTLPPAQARIAGLTHWAIYAALIALPVLGYIRVRAGGFPIETLDALGLPPLVPRSEPLANLAKSLHALAGFALAGLVLMHMGAAAYHGLIRRDGIFSRMWPPFGAGRDN